MVLFFCVILSADIASALPKSSTMPAVLCDTVVVQDASGQLTVYLDCQPSGTEEDTYEDSSDGCYYGEDCYDNYVEYP